VLRRDCTHLKQISNNALEFGVVKPRHLGYFGNQNHNHLQDLLIASRTFLHQKVNQVVFYLQFLANFYFEPVVYKNLFDTICGKVLRVAVG
jgi:hypothetical protein